MPLQKARGKSKKAMQAAVSANMHELTYNGRKTRTQKQKIAIALNAARGEKPKKKK
jgi:hypothetical protein